MKSYAARMFQNALRFLGLVALGGALLGCQQKNTETHPEGSITVKVPVLQGKNYVLGLIELTTITELVNLRGAAAQFLFSPSVVDGRLVGHEPRIRTLRTSDGVYVAQDSLSLQLLSLYAQFEGLMKLDEKLGTRSLLSWPRTVAVQTKVIDENGGRSRNNARYSSQLDAFLFEPFEIETDIPLTVNAGVVGHEHFHALFYQLVLKKLGGVFTQSSVADLHTDHEIENIDAKLNANDLYDISLLRGVNEGLADVWGWIFSGDTDFVVRSLRFEKTRSLEQDPKPVESTDDFAEKLTEAAQPRETRGLSYDVGSNIAKIIYGVAPNASSEVRLQIAAAILKTLPQFASAVQRARAKTQKIRPALILEILSRELSLLGDAGCKRMRGKVGKESASEICPGSGFKKGGK